MRTGHQEMLDEALREAENCPLGLDKTKYAVIVYNRRWRERQADTIRLIRAIIQPPDPWGI